jgi:hemerythrin-like metal-binding protein
MSPAIEWQEWYNVGLGELDRDHQFFIDDVNTILDLGTVEEKLFILNQIHYKMKMHFALEEQYLNKVDDEHHYADHAHLLRQVNILITQLSNENVSSEKIHKQLTDWFFYHMMVLDKPLAMKINEQLGNSPTRDPL